MATAKLHGTFLPNPPPLSPFEWHEECFLLLMGPLTVGLNPRCAPILPDPPARPGTHRDTERGWWVAYASPLFAAQGFSGVTERC